MKEARRGLTVVDVFTTGAPVTPIQVPEGAVATVGGLNFPVEDGVPITFTSSFKVPPGGRVIENCATLEFAGGGPRQTPVHELEIDPNFGLSATPAPIADCTDDDGANTQTCRFTVAFANNSHVLAVAEFTVRTDPPALDEFAGPSGAKTETVDGAAVHLRGWPGVPHTMRKSLRLARWRRRRLLRQRAQLRLGRARGALNSLEGENLILYS